MTTPKTLATALAALALTVELAAPARAQDGLPLDVKDGKPPAPDKLSSQLPAASEWPTFLKARLRIAAIDKPALSTEELLAPVRQSWGADVQTLRRAHLDGAATDPDTSGDDPGRWPLQARLEYARARAAYLEDGWSFDDAGRLARRAARKLEAWRSELARRLGSEARPLDVAIALLLARRYARHGLTDSEALEHAVQQTRERYGFRPLTAGSATGGGSSGPIDSAWRFLRNAWRALGPSTTPGIRAKLPPG